METETIETVGTEYLLKEWVANLSPEEASLLELFRDKVREQAFEDVMQVCYSSDLQRFVDKISAPRLSFRLLRVKSFRLLSIPE